MGKTAQEKKIVSTYRIKPSIKLAAEKKVKKIKPTTTLSEYISKLLEDDINGSKRKIPD